MTAKPKQPPELSRAYWKYRTAVRVAVTQSKFKAERVP